MSGAVFLSYTSQDAVPAKRICGALQSAGIEVWFDQSELRGGDAWDAKIRKQIKDCTLFVPLISANTQARHEGYFRLEWHLAEQRSHLIARGRPLIVPVAIDGTNDAEAIVPDAFLAVQWMRVPGGEATSEFCGRVKALLSGEFAEGRDRPIAPVDPKLELGGPAPRRKRVSLWLLPSVVGAVGIFILAFWQPWRRTQQTPPAGVTVAPAPSEARQLVAKARGFFDALGSTRDDYNLADELLAQAEAKDATDAEVWAAAAQLDELYAIRGWDPTDTRREAARAAAQRALRFDPQSFEVRLAQVGLLGDTDREGAEKEKLLRALRQEKPDDHRVLRALGTTLDRLGRIDESSAVLDESAALPGGDPLALYDKSMNFLFVGRTTEAETTMRAVLAQNPFGSALLMTAWYQTVLDGDLAGAEATLGRIPVVDLQEDRAAFFGFYLAYLRRDPEAALARLQAVPRDWLNDNWYRGPKSRLIGDALHLAGRPDAAVAEWRAALKLVDERLAAKPTLFSLLFNRVLLLVRLGQSEEAERQFSALVQMEGIDPAGTAPVKGWVTDLSLALGHKSEVIQQLERGLKQERHAVDYTAAILRLDPDWDPLRADPAFQKVLAEAEAMEKTSWPPPPVKAP